jgi:hypothetical protein
VERHTGGLHVPLGEVEVLLELVEDGAAAGVDAEVVEGELEVGDVGLHVDAQQPARDEAGEEEDLLRQGQHERAERGDVGLECVAGNAHEVLGQRDADAARLILLLEHAAVALGVRALVRAHRVHQLVLGAPPLAPSVRQKDGRATHPEDAIGQQHRPVVAEVPIQGDVLGAYHHRVRVAVHLYIITESAT